MNASLTRRLGIVGTALVAGTMALSFSSTADAISRDEVMTTARSYALHPWHCTSANLSISCASGYSSHFSGLCPGDFMGVAYNWGGFSSLFEYDQEIDNGYGAGSYNNYSGWPSLELTCTTGVDCSGYVSRCWDLGYQENTTGIQAITSSISQSAMLAGDVFNSPGFHVVMLSHRLPNGDPVFYEATPPYHVWAIQPGWSYVSGNGFTPRHYPGVTGGDAGDPVGTVANPIQVPAFPGSIYTDTRNTAQSTSDVFDRCDADTSKDESGPEYIYQLTITQPGRLRVHVDGYVPNSIDIDVHLYTAMNTSDCIARDHVEFFEDVDCGTYYVVADTFGGDSNAGQYTLTIDLQNPGGSCGSGPPGYDFKGGLGSPCGGYCNYNLWEDGELVCMTAGTTQYCTGPCESHAECQAQVDGACCEPASDGKPYCFLPQHCTGVGGYGGSGTGGGGVGNNGTGGAGVGGDNFGNNTGTAANDIIGPDRKKSGGEESGCTVTGAPSGKSAGVALAALLLLGPAAWRRRRSRRRQAA